MAEATAGWEELKDLGNAAFKERQFEKAVEHFTDAIELHDSHLLYSNRSGAHASLAQWKEALADADKCVALKPDFAKGYGRKGAAHEGLGQLAKAKEAYEAGLARDPHSETLRAALESATRRLSAPRGAPPPFAYGRPPSAPVLTGPALLLNYAIVMCFILYMLPLFGMRVSFYAYRLTTLLCAAKYTRAFLLKFGISRTLLTRWNEIKASESAHYLALSLALLLWRPIPFVLVPMSVNAVGAMVPALVQQVKTLPARVQALIGERIQSAGTEEGQTLIALFATTSEVMLCVGLALTCFASVRNVGMLLFYLNFLSWRHASSQLTQQAVWALRTQMDGWFHHKWAPKLLGVAYEKCKMMLGVYISPAKAR